MGNGKWKLKCWEGFGRLKKGNFSISTEKLFGKGQRFNQIIAFLRGGGEESSPLPVIENVVIQQNMMSWISCLSYPSPSSLGTATPRIPSFPNLSLFLIKKILFSSKSYHRQFNDEMNNRCYQASLVDFFVIRFSFSSFRIFVSLLSPFFIFATKTNIIYTMDSISETFPFSLPFFPFLSPFPPPFPPRGIYHI